MISLEESRKSLRKEVERATKENRMLQSFNFDDIKEWSPEMRERVTKRIIETIHRQLVESIIYGKGYINSMFTMDEMLE